MSSEERVLSGIPPELARIVPESVCTTFGSLSGGEIMSLAADGDQPPCDGLFSLVSFVGDLGWSFMLELPRATALGMTAAFMGSELDFDSADMSDAVGEFANILAGDFAARLEKLSIKTRMSLPTVARGHDVELLLPHEVPTHPLAFMSPAGSFRVRIIMGWPVGGVVSMPGEARREAGVEAHFTRSVCWACPK